MTLPYTTLDVFTSQPFTGNPLAVVWDADALTDAQMQSVAAEFGYSETTFVCKSGAPGVDAHVRIFTPTFELPFAGHPTIGTAIAYAQRNAIDLAQPLVFKEKAGLVRIDVSQEGDAFYAQFQPPQPPKVYSQVELDLTDCIGVDHCLLATNASAGTPFSFVELESAEQVDASFIAPGFAYMMAALQTTGLYLFAKTGPRDIYARLFAPEIGVSEDPATGSAVAALAAVMARDSWPAGKYHIKQGVKMGRPSDLYLTLGEGGPFVGGHAVEIMHGTIRI